jgi:kynurenine formamidase
VLIDVSMTVEPGAVFRVGTPPVEIASQQFYDQSVGKFEATMLSLPAHTATHIDLVYKEKRISLDQMIGRGKLINVTQVTGREIQVRDIENQVDIQSGDLMLFRTDWSTCVGTAKYHAHPEVASEVVDWLIQKGINMVGIDAGGLGREHKHGQYDRILAQSDIFVIENLTNLSAIPGQAFTVYCFPLKLEGVDAIPARVVVQTDHCP